MMRLWTGRNGSNPLGSLSLHPRCGKIRADVNRQIIQNSAYGRGRSAFEILFGSGSAGLGLPKLSSQRTLRWSGMDSNFQFRAR